MSKLRALTMPKWGIEMAEGTIAEWRVKPGDRIKKTQVIALIETDKIANDLESEFEGTVARLVAEAGTVYPVGALLGVIAAESASDAEVDAFVKNFRAAEGSAADAAQGEKPAAALSAPAPPAAPARIPADANISPAARKLADSLGLGLEKLHGSGRRGRITLQDVDQAGKPAAAPAPGKPVALPAISDAPQAVFASPYALRVARERGVDLAKVKPTGARGRISRADVLNAAVAVRSGTAAVATTAAPAAASAIAAGAGAGASYTVERFSPMRKAIAKALTLSKSTIPHFYLRVRARMDALVSMREEAKKAGGSVPSINDYLVRASALALIEVPQVNVQVHAEEIHRYAHADIAVAVATDRGLITPIVRAADQKPVTQIAAEIRALAERARAGKLKPEEYAGGTFCISNLGMFGVDEFEAIINPPQGAILAVGAMRRQFVEDGAGISFANTLVLSLSCDHRAIDGAVGARFLAALKARLENPQTLV